MFPVLYTDTTDAWRLTDKRKRLLIDSGGIIVELTIAAIAIFLWSFLPDGPARSAAFFAATTSWVLSLMVNLNPCMRFDGYYLLGDLFGIQNMQARGFELGRWKMLAVAPARIVNIHITLGQAVSAGDPLFDLSSESLVFQRQQSEHRIAMLTAQLNRQASNMEERRLSAVLDDDLKTEKLTLKSIDEEIAELSIVAPHDGVITALPQSLHQGRYITQTDKLMQIVDKTEFEVLALAPEGSSGRLSVGSEFTFINDDPQAPKIEGHLKQMAPTTEAYILEPILTSMAGGPLAVHEDDMPPQRTQRGIVKIKAKAQSPATALWKSIVRVLIRETDF